MSSLFFFDFRLGPWEGCLNLNFDQVQLAPGFSAVCTRDHLGILWRGDPKQHVTASGAACTLARILVHADALFSCPKEIVLEVEPVTWLEVRDCTTTKIVNGYMHQTLSSTPLDSSHPDKIRLCRAAQLTYALGGFPSLKFAIADFYTARREVGPYSAFYAYRVLEDIRNHFGHGKDDKADWNRMNAALGTTKDKWSQLTEAGTLARHLGDDGLRKLETMDRAALMGLAHEAMNLCLTKIGIG